jgi:hypothetical protein
MAAQEKIVRLGTPRDPAYLYYVDEAGNVVRRPRLGSEAELVAETKLPKEAGWVYIVDADGDVARVTEAAAEAARALESERIRARLPRLLSVPSTATIRFEPQTKLLLALFTPDMGNVRFLTAGDAQAFYAKLRSLGAVEADVKLATDELRDLPGQVDSLILALPRGGEGWRQVLAKLRIQTTEEEVRYVSLNCATI